MNKIDEIKVLFNETKLISKDIFEQLDFLIPKVLMTKEFKNKLNDTSNENDMNNFIELVDKLLNKIHVYILLSDDYHRNGELSQQDMIQYEKTEVEINNILEMLLAEEPDYIFDPPIDIRTCKSCGCTDIHACPGGCHWVTDDLCSNCVYKVIVEKGFKASAGTYYQEVKTVIAEEVISLEEVEAMIYGYASALGYEHWYDGEWNDDIEDINKGTEVLRFDINKGEETQHVYFYKKQ